MSGAPARPAAPPPIGALDAMPATELVAHLAPLFEGAPRFLARLADARPFGSDDRLFGRAREIALEMPEDEQIELIDAHPRLGAPSGVVSALSYREQGYDRESADRAAEQGRARIARELDRLNAAYEARFGFRYCVFVAGRPRAALLAEMERALEADRASEIRRALGQIVAIAQDRLRRLREGEWSR